MAHSHSDLLKKTLIALSKARVATAFRMETGVARSMDGQRIISFGLKGASDIIGITSQGVWLSVEIKIGADKLRPEQENFRNMILNNKGKYFLIRSEEDIENAITELKNGQPTDLPNESNRRS